MGWGDEILSTGMARGAKARGKRIAFGDGKEIKWGPWCEQMFRNNPNIARPGDEAAPDIEWIHHYKGNRLYVTTHGKRRWIFNPHFRVKPGEMFFDDSEIAFAEKVSPGFILIEPRVKPCYPNKQWPVERYREVAERLLADGHRVLQFLYGKKTDGTLLDGIEPIISPSLRQALAIMARAAVFIGPEGALTHGAAAVGTRAVVLFGGFSNPKTLSYPQNINLTGGAHHCGFVRPCLHCQRAMHAITVDQVYQATMGILNARALRDAGGLGEQPGLESGGGTRDLQRGDPSLSAAPLPTT